MSDVVMHLSADQTKLLKAFDQIMEKQRKMDEGMAGIKDKTKDAGKEFAQSFGTRAVESLKAYATGFVTIGTAVSAVKGAMELLRQETAQAKAVMDGLVESSRGLNQIATSAENRQAMADQRAKLARTTGVPLPEIENVQFMSMSTGYQAAVPDVVRAAGANLITAQEGSLAATKIPLLYREQGLTPKQSLNAVLAAAGEAPANFGEIVMNLETAAEGATQQGVSPAETMAVLGKMSEKMVPAVAAQRINRFTANLAADKRFAGKGFVEALNMLATMPEAQRNKFIGDSIQMSGGYSAFMKLKEGITGRTELVQRAIDTANQPGNLFDERIAQSVDPNYPETNRNRLRMQANIAQRESELQLLEAGGAGGLSRQAGMTRAKTRMREYGINPFHRWAYEKALEWTDQPGNSGEVMQATGDMIPMLHNLVMAMMPFGDSSQRIYEASKLMVEAAERTSEVNRQRAAAAAVAE